MSSFLSHRHQPLQGNLTDILDYLGNLRLVGGVLGGPARVLEHVPQDGVRDAGVVVPHADVASPYLDG